MKRTVIIAFATLLAAAAIVVGVRFLGGDEGTWTCINGEWVKHGNPSSPKPTVPCPGQAPEVVITSPQPHQAISTPLTVTGKAKGHWFFEANAVLRLLDAQQREIASGTVQALGDWMTDDFVDFEGQIRFLSPASGTGILVLQNDNPSGLPDNQKEFRVPVRFDASHRMKAKAYFGSHKLDPESELRQGVSGRKRGPNNGRTCPRGLGRTARRPDSCGADNGLFHQHQFRRHHSEFDHSRWRGRG